MGVVLGNACADTAAEGASVDSLATPQLIVVASESELARAALQCGMEDMLLGWDEAACLHFRRACDADPGCVLARAALMLTEGVTAESRAILESLLNEEYLAATPAELSLVETWLRLLRGERAGAGEEFAARAEQYRADVLSACWAIILLHDGYDESHKPLPNQQRALDMAAKLYERKADNPYVCYLRAWVEEAAPSVSDEALTAARAAASALQQHPSAQLLLGHLLFRRGQLEEAAVCFHRAEELAESVRKNVPCGTFELRHDGDDSLAFWPLEVRAKLYESTVLWMLGRERESLQLQSILLKEAGVVELAGSSEPGAVLLQWEARSLPLRMLMLRSKLPSVAQVNAASKAAQPAQPVKENPLLELRDCLRFCLVARQRAAANRGEEAVRCIKAAEARLKRLSQAEEQCKGQGSYYYSAWVRAHEACTQALYAAKAAAYPDTASIWLQSLEHAQRPASLLMPPVLPRN